MVLLTNPTRPKPPRMNKRRQITQHDSQTTLREEQEEEDLFDMVPPPPLPPKLDTSFDQKSLPITPQDSTVYLQRSNFTYKPSPFLPKPASKPSTANRWKSAVGKIIGFKKASPKKPKYVSPPLSPASSRQPSFYGPAKDQRPHRSAVTLLNSAASTVHSRYDEDEDMVTNIGLSRSSSQNVTPISPRGGFHVDHYEPITTVLQRADLTPSPTPVTALPISPITPAPRSITPPSRHATPPRDSPPRTVRSTRSHRSLPAPSPSPSPPPFTWPPPGSPPLIVANPSPPPSPSPPSPPPAQLKRRRAQTVTIARTPIHPPALDGTPAKRAGPRILQAQVPSPVSPDPDQHVFIGPWFNRRGDEWLGIGAELGLYRSKPAKEEKAFDPKYMGYPEEPHHFMNPKGDVMDAQTLRMISKAPRVV